MTHRTSALHRPLTIALVLVLAVLGLAPAASASTYRFSGTVAAWGDDWNGHTFWAAEGSRIGISMSQGNADADVHLYLKKPNGDGIAKDLGDDGRLSRPAPVSGRYKIAVMAKRGKSSYALTVETTKESSSTTSTTTSTTSTTTSTASTTTSTADATTSASSWSASGGTPVVSLGPESQMTRTEAVNLAKRFDVVVGTAYRFRDHIGAMRNANPDLMVLAYLNGVFADDKDGSKYPGDWYLRTKSGAKVRSDGYGNYMMNPRKSGWRRNRLALCKELIGVAKADGCMLDMLGTAPIDTNYVNGLPIDPSTGKVWTKNALLSANGGLAARMKDGVGSKKIYGNGLGSGGRYFNSSAPSSQLLDGINGGVAEAWIRASRHKIDNYRSESEWRKDVDLLVDSSRRSKGALVVTKTWVSATSGKKRKWHNYAHASFLLGNQGRAHFTFLESPNTDPTDYNSAWSVNVGAPTGAYYKHNGLYRRPFSNGVVFVNPTGSGKSVNLGGTYRKPNGTTVSGTITVGAHTGLILRKV